MVVISPIQAMLIARNPVVKHNLPGQSAFGKKLQSAIDRRVAKRPVQLFHQRKGFILYE
jgi:hypothetical protein